MNLEVFNRVNWKETYHSSGRNKNQSSITGMYSKWTSLTHKLYSRTCYEHLEDKSVLSKFSSNAGKQVTVLIVKQLASSLGITHAAEPSNLTSEKEIHWCMEVICYGLMLPLTEHDTVRDCVNVYCEWLSALHSVPKISVPVPVCKDANFFARRIIAHFLNLFMPRNGEGSDVINKQAVLCHRVLRTLQNVTQISKNIESDTWQTLLLFLLTINDTLLAPPTIKDDVGDQLCERVLSVLLEIWLTACVKWYPSPPLWKTLREMAINWRHRTALIEQWNRINLTLTSKVLEIMYGVSFSQLKIGGDEDLQMTINNMSEECVMQTWFRILHAIGNPIDLCHSNIISQTPQFLQYAITNDSPSEHPCLNVLPLNFYKAIKGIASLVDAFLGTPVFIQWEEYSSFPGYQQTLTQSSLPGMNTSTAVELCSPTPPSRRRIAKSFSVSSAKSIPKGASGSSNKSGGVSNQSLTASSQNTPFQGASSLNYISHLSSSNRNVLLSPLRPKCNSILHLFGDWLFEASHNLELPRSMPAMVSGGKGNMNWTTGETGSISSGSVSSFLLRKGSSSQPNSLTTDSSDPDTGASTPLATSLVAVSPSICDKFVCGRAEAVGTLCRIFCSKKTGEEILPIYLSRFYMIIQQSLRVKEFGECDEVMASVLLNSVDIFSLDLDGVLLLIPYFIEALEIVLPERNLRFNDNVALMSATNVGTGGSSSNNTQATSSLGNVPSSNAVANSMSVSASTAMVNAGSVAVPPISTVSMIGSSVVGTTFANVTSTSSIGCSDVMSDVGSAFNYNMSTHFGGDGETGAGITVSNVSIPSNMTSNNSSTSMVTTSTAVALVELRKACTHLLLSMLPLPLHFQNLPIKEFGHVAYRLNMSGACVVTFGQLRSRLVNLVINALQIETDSLNTHLLLGGLLFVVQDSALCEQALNMSNSSSSNDFSSSMPTSDSAHSLFVRSMYLVCHRLISSWKMDLNVSLAALEFLSGLARINIREMDILECKRAVKWLCDFIMHQCWRPPQAHSKDLHSSIVAAFQCAAQWLISHPALLKEKECLNTLLEVVELGISGSKSQGKLSEPIRMKDEKELKPVSMRVRDAAEALLTIIMEQITDTGINSSSLCLLDEVVLLKQFVKSTASSLTYERAVSKFHYFLFENNTMIALLQEPLEDSQPTITVLIRNCFGRHSWTLQLRHLPRHRSATKQNYCNLQTVSVGRHISMSETSLVPTVHQRYFPDYVNKIETYTADKSIQSLESISDGVEDGGLEELIEQHYYFENENDAVKSEWFAERNPPSACDDFHTARMFLCHLGLLSKYKNTNKQNDDNCSLIALDNSKEGFAQELKVLDEISTKTYDTCHIFYVKTGQKNHVDILENTLFKSNISQHFIELLYSLGWPVEIKRHTGWTGHTSSSSTILRDAHKMAHSQSSNPNRKDAEENGSCLYDGIERIIYWSDVISEVAFVVPSSRLHSSLQHNTGNRHERSASVNNENSLNDVTVASNNSSLDKMRTMSLDDVPVDAKPSSSSSVFNKKRVHLVTTVMLVWLESFEDHFTFPINELQPYTNTGVQGSNKVDVRDCYVIFLHAMQNGLLRVKLQGPVNRMYIATPLVDGMVISRRSAGHLVRQTVLNICKRRRLDSDNYQLPHVRRRLKFQEMKDRYECKMDTPELLTYLLKNC